MKTLAIYQDRPDRGHTMIGLFAYQGSPSVQAISAAYRKLYPEAHKAGQLYVAFRQRVNGVYIDGEQLLMEQPDNAEPADLRPLLGVSR